MKLTKIFSRIIVLAVCLLPGFLQQGCTRNNGDIGNWFGRWQITEILADGTPESGYHGEFFLDFQNDIIRGIQLAPNGYDRDTAECYGTWSQPSDDALVFDFSHHQDKPVRIYTPFPGLHFPDDGPFTLSVSESSGDRCTLRYVAPDGTGYTYKLHKR